MLIEFLESKFSHRILTWKPLLCFTRKGENPFIYPLIFVYLISRMCDLFWILNLMLLSMFFILADKCHFNLEKKKPRPCLNIQFCKYARMCIWDLLAFLCVCVCVLPSYCFPRRLNFWSGFGAIGSKYWGNCLILLSPYSIMFCKYVRVCFYRYCHLGYL